MTNIATTKSSIPKWQKNGGRKVLVLATSPREDGNSHLLAQALCQGANAAGHDSVVTMISPHVKHMMKYCRECRGEDGRCGLDDGFSEIFQSLFQPADAVVFATPIWWYGMTAHMKNFLDRIACEISASNDAGAKAKRDVIGKRMALLLSAEENNFACRMAILTQFNELSRHLRADFVGVVTGIGNLRGEISKDPLNPVRSAKKLGERLFQIEETDYELDSDRSFAVWPDGDDRIPAYWR